MVVTWLVPHETAAVSACYVYTTQSVEFEFVIAGTYVSGVYVSNLVFYTQSSK